MKIKFRRGYDGPAGTFNPGDIAEINKNLAIDICNADLARPVREKEIETQVKREKEEAINKYPLHKGGGWYELSNGQKIQGKEEAVKTEEELS